MLQLVARLEYERQAFIRRRLLRNLGASGLAYWGIAGLLFFMFLFPMTIAAPVALAEAPPEAVAVGGLVVAGFILCATIILAPVGLILF